MPSLSLSLSHSHSRPLIFASCATGFAGALIVVACSSSDSGGGTAPTTTDSGTTNNTPDVVVADVNIVVTDDGQAKQTGTIIQAQTTSTGVPDASVTIGTTSVVTNANGEYQIIVPRNTPYQMTVSADGFYTLHEQEYFVKTNLLERGVTNLLSSDTASFLASLLPGRDETKGLLLVKVNPRPPCDTEEGSTLAIDPPGQSKLSYFSGPLPSSAQTSTKGGTDFSGVFYNVDVGVAIKVIVTSPKCKQVAFPVEVGDVTYTGEHATVTAGEALTYVRTYIQDPL